MVPLGLGDRLSLARAAAAEDSLHVVGRRGPDARSSGVRLRARGDRGGATGRRAGRGHVPARGAPREAHPDRRRAWPGGAATPRPPSMAPWRRGAPDLACTRARGRGRRGRLGRAVLPRRRAGPGRGSRRPGDAAQPAGRRPAGRAARDAGARDRHAGRLRGVRHGPGRRAGEPWLDAPDLAAPRRRARPGPPADARATASSAVPASSPWRTTSRNAADLLAPGLRALRRALTRLLGVPIGLSGSGPYAVGALSFPRRRGGGRGTGSGGARLGPARQPGVGPAVRRRDDHRQRTWEEAGMTRRAVSTSSAPPAAGPYSQAIATDDLVFCAGQLGSDPATGRARRRRARPRPSRPCATSQAVLDAAGCTFADVVKTTCFLADINDFAAFNEVYAAVHVRSAAGPLHVPGRGAAEGRPGRDRGDRRSQPGVTPRLTPSSDPPRMPARPFMTNAQTRS